MSAEPMRGVVEAMSQTKVVFICNSKKEQQTTGTMVKYLQGDHMRSTDDDNGEYNYHGFVTFDEVQASDLKIQLQL